MIFIHLRNFSRVFNDCHSLKSLVIPDGVTSIGEDAFASCESLKSLVIPASVVNIKGDPFYCWTGKLRCLSPYYIYEDNVLFDRDKSTIISFRDIKATSYTIPDSVTSIGERAFSGCESLKSLVIPDCVTSIGDETFYGCCFPNDLKQELISRFGNRIFVKP